MHFLEPPHCELEASLIDDGSARLTIMTDCASCSVEPLPHCGWLGMSSAMAVCSSRYQPQGKWALGFCAVTSVQRLDCAFDCVQTKDIAVGTEA